MLPISTVPNGVDCFCTDAVLCCQFGSGTPGSLSYFEDGGLCKQRAAMSDSLQTMLSSLGNFIRGIVCIRTKEEMFGVDAEPVVTAVANMEVSRNSSFVDLERYSVGSLRFFTDHYLPVSLRPAGHPDPAVVFTADCGL